MSCAWSSFGRNCAPRSVVGHLPNECADRFLAEAPALNVTEHDVPSSYYDDRLASLVAERDRKVIERYGYTL